MPMSPEEKQKVIDMLDQMGAEERKQKISSFESFRNWLSSALSQIYNKIKDSLQSLWRSLKTAFS